VKDNISETINQRYQEIQALSPTSESLAAVPEEPSISVSSFLSLSLFIFFFVVIFLGFLPLLISRFRDFKRFQMALVMAFLAGALPLSVGLVLHQSGLLTTASLEETPRQVKIVDVTQASFRVQWETSGSQYGAIRYGTEPSVSSINQTALEFGGLRRTSEHNVLVENLLPDTDYYFEIISGSHWYDNNGVLLHAKTLPK